MPVYSFGLSASGERRVQTTPLLCLPFMLCFSSCLLGWRSSVQQTFHSPRCCRLSASTFPWHQDSGKALSDLLNCFFSRWATWTWNGHQTSPHFSAAFPNEEHGFSTMKLKFWLHSVKTHRSESSSPNFNGSWNLYCSLYDPTAQGTERFNFRNCSSKINKSQNLKLHLSCLRRFSKPCW